MRIYSKNMQKISIFSAFFGAFFSFMPARAADLPLCNDDDLTAFVAAEIEELGKNEYLSSPLDIRAFELIKKYAKNLIEINPESDDGAYASIIKDKIMELKINKDLSIEDIRVCKSEYAKVKNNIYALIYPNADAIYAYVFSSIGDNQREGEKAIKN